jgi:hypothetical protein
MKLCVGCCGSSQIVGDAVQGWRRVERDRRHRQRRGGIPGAAIAQVAASIAARADIRLFRSAIICSVIIAGFSGWSFLFWL